MAYSRFWDSDLYIYSHVNGYVCCAACWLSNEAESEIIKDDQHLYNHIEEHKKAGHDMPEMLYYEIVMDEKRYDAER